MRAKPAYTQRLLLLLIHSYIVIIKYVKLRIYSTCNAPTRLGARIYRGNRMNV